MPGHQTSNQLTEANNGKEETILLGDCVSLWSIHTEEDEGLEREDGIAKAEASHPLAEFSGHKGNRSDNGEASEEGEWIHDLLVGQDSMVEETTGKE